VAYPVAVGHPVPAGTCILTEVENGCRHVVVDGVDVALTVSPHLELHLRDAGGGGGRLEAHAPQVFPRGHAQRVHLPDP
jgi:hypothetical protein